MVGGARVCFKLGTRDRLMINGILSANNMLSQQRINNVFTYWEWPRPIMPQNVLTSLYKAYQAGCYKLRKPGRWGPAKAEAWLANASLTIHDDTDIRLIHLKCLILCDVTILSCDKKRYSILILFNVAISGLNSNISINKYAKQYSWKSIALIMW